MGFGEDGRLLEDSPWPAIVISLVGLGVNLLSKTGSIFR